MTIERSCRSHWRAATQTQIVEPGYREVVSTGFGWIRELIVESGDRLRKETYHPEDKDTPMIGPSVDVYEGEAINDNSESLSPTHTSIISLIKGERVNFKWSEDSSQV